ncbi:MAG: hypothetical protein WC679_02665 [Bacteroidales bacterium]|jgi:hypothetical protein
MIVYRAMCEAEFNETMNTKQLSWLSRFKWFGTLDFIKQRVTDGKFNNSTFIKDRYCKIIKFEIDDSSLCHFKKVGYRELMLDRRKTPLIKITVIGIYNEI